MRTVEDAVAGATGDVDAVFVSCTNIRTAGAIEPLEQRLGLPVVTSNQAAAWHVLSTFGLEGRSGGRLMGPRAVGADS